MADQLKEKNERKNKRGTGRKRRKDDQSDQKKAKPEFEERVVHVSRNSKVVKGGRRFSFGALVVIGNHKGQVGYGLGKAAEVAEFEASLMELQMMEVDATDNTDTE